MKKLFATVSVLVMAYGCDAPQRSNYVGSADGTSSLGTPTDQSAQNFTQPTTTATTTTTTGTATSIQSTAGFENCDLSPKYYSAGLGYLGICQSSSSETTIAMQPNSTDSSVRTCLIPTYKEANGSSTYLGQPQCTYTQANVTVMGTLYKTRIGFTQYPLNGLMVMKETSLAAYFNCMDAYVNYGKINPIDPNCPYGPQTSPNCDLAAKNYMGQVCSTFQTTNSYIDIRLK